MASSSQGMRTFGDKPKAFQLEEGGELYYVGSEVYLGNGLNADVRHTHRSWGSYPPTFYTVGVNSSHGHLVTRSCRHSVKLITGQLVTSAFCSIT